MGLSRDIVEDELAWQHGINNRATAHGLVSLFRLLQDGRAISPAACRSMLATLHQQALKSGIPAGLPPRARATARIAHKTGEISTIAHDSGLVFLPRRRPYAVAVLSQWEPATTGRQAVLAEISRAVYEHVTRARR